jgi:hypothetical protein
MSDTVPGCYRCRKPLDPRDDHATVELNSIGDRAEAVHRGKLCSNCESEVVLEMRKSTDGNL